MQNNWPDVPSILPSRIIAYRYRLGQSLGIGGLGEVFYAEDLKFSPPRIVALKLLHPELLTDPDMQAQIKREASTMAQLSHPNILRVIDFEIKPEEAYIITEFAAGGSLKQKIRPNKNEPPLPLPLNEIPHYLKQIATALDFSHQKGLIHRDLKPQNILLDAENRPLLADFSLALEVPNAGKGKRAKQLVKAEAWGTAEYAAPEVWQEKAGKASDIYALGVLTYELITGSTPYQGDATELEKQHLSAAIPGLRKYETVRNYPGELDTVLAAALAKKPQQRPKTAGEFARRFSAAVAKSKTTARSVTDAPAETPTKKTFPKSKFKLLGGLIGLLLPLGLLGWYLISFGLQSLNSTVLSGGDYNSCLSMKGVAWSPDGSRLAAACFSNQLMIWNTEGKVVARLAGHTSQVLGVAWSPDGKQLASAANDNTVRLWSTDNKPVATLYGHNSGVNSVAWSPDGTMLASGSNDSTVRLWTAEGKLLRFFIDQKSDWVRSVAWSPDGKTIAAALNNNLVQIWTIEGKLLTTLSGHLDQVSSVAWSPDGKYIATGSEDGNVGIWDSQGRRLASFSGGTNEIYCVAWSPDSKTLASGGLDSVIRLWNIAGRQLGSFTGHTGWIEGLAWSPDGKTLASAAADNTLHLWKIKTSFS